MLADPGLYIHVPWCVRKCPYCDFNSHPLNAAAGNFHQYLRALQEDWTSQNDTQQQLCFASVFIGGGTPSLCPPDVFADLLTALPLSDRCEVTMEANPGTTEYHNLADYRAAGINRLSLGAQSFDDNQLHKLGRIHAADETLSAFGRARAAGFDNINVDLMWGLPEQSVDAAMADLDAAIELAPEHISWYQLTIEAKTEFARRTPILPMEESLADMEQYGLAKLQAAGYQRYEVSAFAQNDRQCRHNLNYWRFGDYLGIGAGAHGKLTDTDNTSGRRRTWRTAKASQPRLYLAEPRKTTSHLIAEDALPAEFMLNALRLINGVPRELFSQRTGLDWAEIEARYQSLVERGLLRQDVCATTELGLRYLDSVVAEFI